MGPRYRLKKRQSYKLDSFNLKLEEAKHDYLRNISLDPVIHYDISTFNARVEYKPHVFFARVEATRPPVWAFKRVRKSDYRDNIAALRNEKRHGRSMWSPFVTKLFGTWRGAEHVYFLMECGGKGDMTNLELPVSNEILRVFAAQMLLGLEYMHACNLIHRNFGPHHCLMFANGRLKICSFRTTCMMNPREARGMPTPLYNAAPEMLIEGESYDTKVDWWQFGMTLYYLTLGESYPYARSENDPDDEVRARIVADQKLIDVKEDHPATTAELRDLISQLLQKDPLNRIGKALPMENEIRQHAYFAGVNFGSFYPGKDTSHTPITEIECGRMLDREEYKLFEEDLDETRDPKYEDFDDF